MTTTGERLVAISTLTTGTAMDHFLNIDTGGGPGGVALADFADLELTADQALDLAGDDALDLVPGDDIALEGSGDVTLDGDEDLEVTE